jgi:hypothetical protein
MATYLNRTPSGEGNRKTWTFSTWIKRGIIGTGGILTAGGSGQDQTNITFSSSGGNDRVDWQLYSVSSSATVGRLTTTQQFRDPSAWYHLVCRYDSTQGTAGDRMRMYLNGSEITAFSTDTNPSQNYDAMINNTVVHDIGRTSYNNSNFFSGYLAQTILADGQSYAPTVFGSTNANGIWVPNTGPSVTYGTNGFKLDFAGTGTAADASGFGADSSGNGNHFTSGGLGTNPSTTDTCQNNFATFNPLDNNTVTGNASFSEGNLVINGNSTGSSGAPTNFAVSNGKWYVEGKCLSSTFEFGVFGYGNGSGFNIASNHLGNGYTIDYDYGGNIKNDRSTVQSGLATFTTNDILAIALDMDNNTIKFFKNGSQVGTTLTEANLGTKGPFAFYIATHTSGNTNMFSLNTGNPSYTISSGNADANGYGNFEYAVPSGYYALCTKNLAAYGG